MRTRMSGGVGGGRKPPYPDLFCPEFGRNGGNMTPIQLIIRLVEFESP